ncbi:Uncharacterised protein [uncultured archaeon]|nr:Uncharacterised protein [uncultured archaeon]
MGSSPIIWRTIGLDFISGERVFNKNLIKNYNELVNLPGFGLEVFLNKHIMDEKLKIKVVRWDNVKSPYPNKKFGFIKGNIAFIAMIFQIFSTAGFIGSLYQIIKMLSLKS